MSSFLIPTSVMISQPVVVHVQPGQSLSLPDMTRHCYDCAQLTSGRCWRHSTTIWILHPLVIPATIAPCPYSSNSAMVAIATGAPGVRALT